jgi:hypothetical protein
LSAGTAGTENPVGNAHAQALAVAAALSDPPPHPANPTLPTKAVTSAHNGAQDTDSLACS